MINISKYIHPVKRFRIANDITQLELATIVHLARSTIAQMETGLINPSKSLQSFMIKYGYEGDIIRDIREWKALKREQLVEELCLSMRRYRRQL